MSDQLTCAQCGGPAEKERRDYAVPTCFACLPPPKPLPIAPTSYQRGRADALRELAASEEWQTMVGHYSGGHILWEALRKRMEGEDK